MGMSDEVRKKIFHPFFTTNEDKKKFGSGLSLSVVYNIVTKQSNGYVDVESIEGEGTKFHILLPRGQKYIKIKPKEYFIPIVDATETILVVDDEPSVRHVLKASLQKMGHTVITANNGQECIEKYNEKKDEIDIVILDLTMPEMSGDQAFKKLLAINPEIKVIISSGHTDQEIRKGILSKAHGFLTKPYEINQLGNKIRDLFSKRKFND